MRPSPVGHHTLGPGHPAHHQNGLASSASSAANGVTVLNGGGQHGSLQMSGGSHSLPYETDADNEKWWWVCCLEFCFCLL